MVDYKEVIGWVLGAAIGIVWISFGLLYGMMDYWGGRVFLVVAISLTILLGVLSGGFIGVSKQKNNWKEVVGWLLGAGIGVVWISYGLLSGMMGYWGSRVFVVVAISLTILLGVLSGGLTAKAKKSAKTKES